MLMVLLKKNYYATEITNIKNGLVTNAAFNSRVNDLKSKHIPDEIKRVDDKVKQNITDILNYKTSLDHNQPVINDLEREASFSRGFYYYIQQSYFLYEPKSKSFSKNG